MALDIAVQNVSQQNNLPNEKLIRHWVSEAFNSHKDTSESNLEMTVRIVDEEEAKELNQHWRNKTMATNVLSFPYQENARTHENNSPLLGDIVLCAPIVRREAIEQAKQEESHWAHLIVHGLLHLLGYDHINADDAQQMEAMERSILSKLGYPDPYQTENY